MALTQISTQGIKDGTITGTDLATNIDLVDNQNIRLGTGNDMSLYHDGTNSIIANITGPLALQSNDLQLTDVTNSHPYIKCVRDAQVELYFNNSKKLRTKTAGIEIEGDLGMADNHKIKLGTGEDLQIYHDGSNSYIKQVSSGTGNLLIFADGHEIQLIPKSGEAGIKVINDGSVELFENGVKKAETTTDGFNVEGTLHANEIDMDDNHKIKLGLGDDLQIYHDGSQNIINGATGQNLEIQTNAFRVRNQADSESMIVANADSAVELYHDGSLKFETTSGGSKVTGNFIVNSGHISIDVDNKKLLLGANDDIQIYHDGTNDRIESSGSFLILEASNHIFRNTAGNEDYAKFLGNGAVELYHNGSKKFETVSGGAKVTGTLETTDTISTVGNLDMSDSTSTGNNRIRLGTGDDLEIFHNGTDSKILNSTGDFIVGHNNGIVRIDANHSNNEVGILVRPNGAVELFHDHSKKFETVSGGVNIQGDMTIASSTNAPKITFDENGANDPKAEIQMDQVDGNNGHLIFKTEGSGTLTERFRIKNDGNFLKTISNNSTFRFDQTTTANNRFQSFQYSRSGSSRGDVSQIQLGEGNISEGRINIKTSGPNAGMSGGVFISNGGTSFGSLSDIRLKTKVADISNALTDIAKIDTWKYTWNSDTSNTVHLGITAQSVNEVYPEVVEQTNTMNDNQEDTTEYLAVLHQELIPVCIAAIKELKSKVEELQSEVAALKAG